MYLVVGLGNPGPKYERNRHNVGFMLVDALAERWDAPSFRDKFKARFAKTEFRRDDVLLLEPLTYMNLSGESVQRAMQFFKVSLEQVIVVHDELDVPFGELRVKVGGGTAGHNGLKSIVQHCGGNGFIRVRIGVGRPRSGSTEGHVLGDFPASDRAELPDVLDKAASAVQTIITRGVPAAMNKYNQKPKPKKPPKPKKKPPSDEAPGPAPEEPPQK